MAAACEDRIGDSARVLLEDLTLNVSIRKVYEVNVQM